MGHRTKGIGREGISNVAMYTTCDDEVERSIQLKGGTRIPNQGLEGGVRPKAEKKIVTSPILMVEVVVEVPKGTLDGSKFRMCLSRYSYFIGCGGERESLLNLLASLKIIR